MENRWTVAEAHFAGAPLIVRFSETARDWERHPSLTLKLGFAVPLNRPNEGGLPDPQENSEINGVEDVICEEVFDKGVGLEALALTTGKMREFVFYVKPDLNVAAVHEAVRKRVTTHEVQCLATKEPGWDSWRQFALTAR